MRVSDTPVMLFNKCQIILCEMEKNHGSSVGRLCCATQLLANADLSLEINIKFYTNLIESLSLCMAALAINAILP
jgi:hypothetical protein